MQNLENNNPKQMAHVVGVPKREPCQKCHMPVFLAERLSLGKLMFHRTCLKCARCNSQLSPGSFYETEEDGVFCCETCPDEEKESILNDLRGHPPPPSSNSDGRKSFAEKLAIFQNDNDKGLLRKSLSDEEKSRSLKRLSALYGGSVEYKKNSALSSFMTSQVDETKNVEQQPLQSHQQFSINAENSDSSSDEDNTTESENTPCPVIDAKIISYSSIKQSTNLQITSPIKPDSPPPPLSSSQINLSVVNNDHISESSVYELLSSNVETSCGEIKNNIDSSNDNDVTKEDDNVNISSSATVTTSNNIIVAVPVADDIDKNYDNDDKQINDIAEDKNNEDNDNDIIIRNSNINSSRNSNSSMVRSRLSQFEKLFADDVTATTTISTSSTSATTTTTICNLSVSTSDVKLNVSDSSNNIIDQSTIIIDNNDNNSLVPAEQDKQQQDVSINSDKIVISCEDLTTVSNISKFDHNDSSNNDSDHEQTVTSDIKEENNFQSVSIDSGIANSLLNLPKTISDHINEIYEPIQDHVLQSQIIEDQAIDNVTKSDLENQSSVIPIPRQRVSKVNASSENVTPPTPNRRRSTGKPEVKPRSLTPQIKYPDSLNPFDSDDEANAADPVPEQPLKEKRNSLNPFDSDDDDIEILKSDTTKVSYKANSSLNPFGSDTEDGDESLGSLHKQPVPMPRKGVATSLNPTPEPTPRLSRTHQQPQNARTTFHGSEASLFSPSIYRTLDKSAHLYGSTNSLASTVSSNAYTRRRKGPAPQPPGLPSASSKSQNTSLATPPRSPKVLSVDNSPSGSCRTTPTPRKKRLAPRPPSSTPRKSTERIIEAYNSSYSSTINETEKLVEAINDITIKNPNIQADTSFDSFNDVSAISLSDDASLTANRSNPSVVLEENISNDKLINEISLINVSRQPSVRRRILVHENPHDDTVTNLSDDGEQQSQTEEQVAVVYRRTIVPLSPPDMCTTTDDEDLSLQLMHQTSGATTDDACSDAATTDSEGRQWQKMKENKESQNKNRQSQISLPSPSAEMDPLYSNKSSHGKWKRRKGPAPSLPVPPRKVLQMVPLQEIRHELEVIEVQQQGLEKQGVMLEKMIRDRCEGHDPLSGPTLCETGSPLPMPPNTKEVEDLILQLFELVNEKNELFRRQAELMYLRRQHRLEQEQADIEYEIRLLMAQPERNKPDSDKAREESLITRLVEIVQQRNEVIDSLEMDRIRENEEDLSIKKRLELHNAQRDDELNQQTPTKLSKKEKKKQKEAKKLAKQKKMDADKDADETEINVTEKEKKKKRKFLF